MNLEDKKDTLRNNIASRDSMLIAFSGGVDSALLAALTKETLGEKTLCVLLDSPLMPRSAVEDAQTLARELDLDLEIINVPVMENRQFRKNPPDRCYHCKKISAQILKKMAHELGFACIGDGSNVTDTGEHRPGLRAATEEGIIHPFIEMSITKDEIRKIAKKCGYFFWQKPSAACLASRIPYGEEITWEKLSMIEQAEAFLARWGFTQARVRIQASIARIEVNKEDMTRVLKIKKEVVKEFKVLGFSYITLDLEGYRSGSMDEVL